MNDQSTLSSEQCHTITITVHQKCKLNCLALNEIQKPHFNNIRVVVQMGKKHIVKVKASSIHFNPLTSA